MVIASLETPTKYGNPGKYALYYACETTGMACLADDHLVVELGQHRSLGVCVVNTLKLRNIHRGRRFEVDCRYLVLSFVEKYRFQGGIRGEGINASIIMYIETQCFVSVL